MYFTKQERKQKRCKHKWEEQASYFFEDRPFVRKFFYCNKCGKVKGYVISAHINYRCILIKIKGGE